MANTILTASKVARQAIATLYNSVVMAGLVVRDYDSEFAPGTGSTVNARVPATFVANEFNRNSGITVQDATEAYVPITLDTLLDVSFAVTSEELALDIVDFNAQFLIPAMEAIAQGIDTRLLGLRDDVVASTTWDDYNPTTNPHPTYALIGAGEKLDEKAVPLSERRAVISPACKAQFGRDPLSNSAEKVGDAGTALREASLDRKHGFDQFMTQNITNNVGVAFHRSAFCLATRTLEPAPGAADASVVNYKGLSLRVTKDYDISKKQTVVSVDTLIGVKTLDPDRAVLLTHASDVS